MKIVAIIPSRYGSSRFTAKPMMEIKGVSMIQRVYERTKAAECVTDAVVATDDRRIFDIVESFGGHAVMTSADNRSGTDRVAEAARMIGIADQDLVINVQGDQPLLDPRCLNEVIAPFNRNLELAMSTLAYKIVDRREYTSPKDCKVVFDHEGYALYFSRAPIPCARDADTLFDSFKHLGIYAYTGKFLRIFSELPSGRLEMIEKLEQNRALEYGFKIMVVVTGHDSPEVDLPEDIARIEALLDDNQRMRQDSGLRNRR